MKVDLSYYKYKDKIRTTKKGEKTYIWCKIRKKHLVLQPEELVRQMVIIGLEEECGYPLLRMQVEKKLVVLDRTKRFDIVVYDPVVNPFLLVECKSYEVNITQEVFDQVSAYNLALKAPYLLVSNGHQTLCAKIDFKTKTYQFLEEVPDYPINQN